MVRHVAMLLVLSLLPLYLTAQTTGKVAGTVTDLETGEALPGVNIILESPSTLLGAATDEDGYYVILNVPVGTYEIRARYIGYKEVIVRDLRVSLGLTTQMSFEMEQTALAGEEVVIMAERPLVRRDETNTNIVRTSEEIMNLPTRGLQELASQVAGVVKEDNSNTMNIRGGRGSETAMYIDGVFVNDPYNYAVRVQLPNQAIEEMSVQTGGFNAEYGEAMSGIIAITTNPGTERYRFSMEGITDEFLSPDSKTLGAYSYGYNEYIMTLGGPIIPGTKHTFFLSGTRKYLADWTPSWGWAENPNRLNKYNYIHDSYDPTLFDGPHDGIFVDMDSTSATYQDTFSTRKMNFDARIPNNYSSDWSYTGKVRFHVGKSLELKSSLVQTNREYRGSIFENGISPLYLFNTSHNATTLTNTRSINATLTHTLSQKTFYDLKFNYFDTERESYDPIFQDNLEQYGDPNYNPWPNSNEYNGEAYTTRLKPDFFAPGSQFDDYFKNRTSYYGIDLDIVHQLGKFNGLKAGFEYKYHTMREFRILEPVRLAVTTGITDLERYRTADVRFYGYDIDGKEVDDGSTYFDVERDATGKPVSGYTKQEPYHPIIISGYIQDKIEFRDLIMNVGLRYDHIDPNAWQFKEQAAEFDADGNYVDGTGMFGGDEIFGKEDIKDSEAYYFLSPRLGMSFPVTDRTIFHAQYGKFYQAPQLADLYLSPFYLDAFVSRGGYFTTLDNPNLRPPKTTSYEVGFKQAFNDYTSLQLTAFYKETEDLVQVLNVTTDVTNIAFAENGDFGTIKGFDLILNLRRYRNFSATFNYELQYAKGTGSASGSNFDIAWQGGARGHFPKFAMPLDYEQRHTGMLNLDYRLGADAPTFLKRTGANMVFSFNSGNPYTLMKTFNTMPHTGRYDNDGLSETPISAINAQSSPWVYRVDMKVDKQFPIGSSKITVYAWILNLFNSENVKDVWITTGLPNDTGFLGTTAGAEYWAGLNDVERKQFMMREMDYNNYGIPRQIRLGLQVEI